MKFSRLALTALFGALSLCASPITYNFLTGPNTSGNAYGNTLTYTVSGITVTATAWGLTGPPSNSTFQNAELMVWPNINPFFAFGLGVCDRSEGTNCPISGFDPAQVDNVGAYDFVMFQFSSVVNLSSITINPDSTFDSGRNVSYSVCNGVNPSDLTGHSAGGVCGPLTTINNAAGMSALTVPLTGTGNTLLFGAADPSGNTCAIDFVSCSGFKIDNLTVSYVGNEGTVPEPASFALFGLGLSVLGRARRVKKA
jgi:hypothetical protein